MNTQQVGYLSLAPTIMLLFAIFSYVFTWRAVARWFCRGAMITALMLVIPSIGSFAGLIEVFDFGPEGTSFVYGVHLDAEATKVAILWAGGWMPMLGIVLFVASTGMSLILDEDRCFSQTVDENRRLKKTVIVQFPPNDPDKTPTQVIVPRHIGRS